MRASPLNTTLVRVSSCQLLCSEGIIATTYHAQPCTVFGKNINEHLDMSPFTIHCTVKIQPSQAGPGPEYF